MSERGGGIGSSPGEPSQIFGVPENFLPIIFETFETLDTKTERPGIKATDMAWCDGFMPLGPNNLRTLYGVGDAIFALGGSDLRTILWYGFGNIADTPYAFVLLSDGGLYALNLLMLEFIICPLQAKYRELEKSHDTNANKARCS